MFNVFHGKWNPGGQDYSHIAFSDSVLTDDSDPKDDSCAGGCLNLARPFCKSGHCVRPTCIDAAQFCHRVSKAGQLARAVCPQTCGCRDFTSGLLMQVQDGCPESCSAIRILAHSNQPCKNVPRGNTKLASFAVKIFDMRSQAADTDTIQQLTNLAAKLVRTGCKEVKQQECRLTDSTALFEIKLAPFCPGLGTCKSLSTCVC